MVDHAGKCRNQTPVPMTQSRVDVYEMPSFAAPSFESSKATCLNLGLLASASLESSSLSIVIPSYEGSTRRGSTDGRRGSHNSVLLSSDRGSK